jgi:hypothetical protein
VLRAVMVVIFNPAISLCKTTEKTV